MTAPPEGNDNSSSGEASGESQESGQPTPEEGQQQREPNSRGNYPMPETSPVRLEITETGEQVAQWSASEVTTDVTCTDDRPESPEHGEYVAIEFEVSVEPGFNELRSDGMSMNSNRFTLYDSNYAMSGTDPRTYQCLEDKDELPLKTRGGATSSGMMVFDVEFDSGYLVFEDYLTGDYYEWEYTIS